MATGNAIVPKNRIFILLGNDRRQVWNHAIGCFAWEVDADYSGPEWSYADARTAFMRLYKIRKDPQLLDTKVVTSFELKKLWEAP
jgi:hypothetical protein